MNNHNQSAALQGAGSGASLPVDFTAPPAGSTTATAAAIAEGFVAVVTDLGLIAASGDDAASFLHSQLTNDVLHLDQGKARLAGYCSPKGRLMATFLMWRNADAVYLQLPRAIQPALQKRLQMFIMRAKAKLADATMQTEYETVLGLGGTKAAAALAGHFGALPGAPYEKLDHRLGTLIRVADAWGMARYQWLTSSATAQSVWPDLAATLAHGGNDAWNLSQIHAGIPQIDAATQEKFVPQMVNFELIGGVNFKKGCFPGQEIVARSQYLGTPKRRMMLVKVAGAAVSAGDEVFSSTDPLQPCGMLVNCAPDGAGGTDALVEIKLGAIAEGAVTVGAAAGPALQFLNLPYALDPLEL
jgi:tRNA-modifying protein YgfZ